MARTKEKKQSPAASLIELVTIVAVALGLALGIQAFLVKPFRIPSESMVPTLDIGQRVLVDRVSGRFSDPERGDVLVFKPPVGAEEKTCGVDPPDRQVCTQPTPEKADTNYIKRVVALGGDRIRIVDGQVILNGERQPMRFMPEDPDCALCDLPREVTVPPNHVFMMGDNRDESSDSREWGPVPEEWIIGNAFFTYWPPKRVGPL